MKKTLIIFFMFIILSGLLMSPNLGFVENAHAEEMYIQISMLGNLDYFYDHKLGLEKVGEDLGVNTRYMGPAEWDLNAMSNALRQAIGMKPDGIVVVGFDSSIEPLINEAISQNIPVITVDADLPNSNRIAFVGTGNENAGYQGGQKLAELINEEGKVGILTKPGQSNLEERVAGYKKALDEYENIEIVQVADSQSDPTVAAQAASSMLQRYPDLAGIACVEAAGGSGAATAVREFGKVGEVKIIGMDRGAQILNAIENGVISATLVQKTALMPYYAVEILHNIANNNVPMITTNNSEAGISSVPEYIDTGVVIVDESNYEYFIRE